MSTGNKRFKSGLMWFRRDLRAEDNAALYHALRACEQVICVFVFDSDILDPLPRIDRRVEFIRESLVALDEQLRDMARHPDAGLVVLHPTPTERLTAAQAIVRSAVQWQVEAVFANHDDEPQSLARDEKVKAALTSHGISLHTSKDHVVFERSEVLTQLGKPYTVFTPYKNAWLKKADAFYLRSYPTRRHANALAPRPADARQPVPELTTLGFSQSNLKALNIVPGAPGGQALFDDFVSRMDRYHVTRDFPAVKGPSYLGVHLRFGTVSVRQFASAAHQRSLLGDPGAAVWLSELIWRDFYHQIMHHHPHAMVRSFKPEYDAIQWEEGQHAVDLFQAWCDGRTGYPLVDAAMAQINQTGYMHNRLRMVVASFLVKDLGVDWRWGERYFAQHLNDFDLAANNGGWQWASSSGCDAQPYFRIFNPTSQSEKFDPEGKFIRRYLPQLAGLPTGALHSPSTAKPLDLLASGLTLGQHYPPPIVQHDAARERTLQRYAVVKKAH